MELPETRYAKAPDGVHIAYQVIGDGPLDLVLIHGWISHVELGWEEPRLARFLRRLAAFSRLIIFDKRGTGLSDRTERFPDVDHRMLDIQTVMDAVGSQQAALFGISEGGPMAMLFAAAHPERTGALALWGTGARFSWASDYPVGLPSEVFYDSAAYQEPRWGTGVALAAWAPSLAGDAAARDFFARFQRLAASPATAMAAMTSLVDIDVRAVLSLVQVPTLVLHRRGDGMVPVALGRFVAEGIAGARMVELEGDDHLPWTLDQDRILAEVEEFLTGVRPVLAPDRVLASVLFTDIGGSTEHLAAMGDRDWRLLLDRHDSFVNRQVARHGGRIVKTIGDGVLATFNGPAATVRCARAIVEGARGLGLEVRAGVHAGEVELRGDDVTGLGVHIAQRVSSLAQPGEVLVSRTVVDLVAGSDLTFEDRGERELKGRAGELAPVRVRVTPRFGPLLRTLWRPNSTLQQRSRRVCRDCTRLGLCQPRLRGIQEAVKQCLPTGVQGQGRAQIGTALSGHLVQGEPA